jgi:hypothetical protein
MRYILLAYSNREAWEGLVADWDPSAPLPPEVQAACDFYDGLIKELTESGELITTEGLADPSHTRTLRKTDRGVVTTDGPYAEVKEVLVSYAVIDCETHDRALAIAARVVDAVGDTVELRPIMDGPGVLEA